MSEALTGWDLSSDPDTTVIHVQRSNRLDFVFIPCGVKLRDGMVFSDAGNPMSELRVRNGRMTYLADGIWHIMFAMGASPASQE